VVLAERGESSSPDAGEPAQDGRRVLVGLPPAQADVRDTALLNRPVAQEHRNALPTESWDVSSSRVILAPLPMENVPSGVPGTATAIGDHRAAVVSGLVQEWASPAERASGDVGFGWQPYPVGSSAPATTRDGADRYFALVFIAALLAARRELLPAEETSKDAARWTTSGGSGGGL
jgi:hypothetical protein